MSFQNSLRKTVSPNEIGMLIRQPGNSNTPSFEGNLSKHTNERTISYLLRISNAAALHSVPGTDMWVEKKKQFFLRFGKGKLCQYWTHSINQFKFQRCFSLEKHTGTPKHRNQVGIPRS